MSLIRRQKRISAKQVAEILGCAENTVHNKGAGTAQLTRIRNGSRQVRFLLNEVLALADGQEANPITAPTQAVQQEDCGQLQAAQL